MQSKHVWVKEVFESRIWNHPVQMSLHT